MRKKNLCSWGDVLLLFACVWLAEGWRQQPVVFVVGQVNSIMVREKGICMQACDSWVEM
jgi:hypothetical protein